jgi:glyoxylase-like metal-dependent hydrolase (beta-lactamase superfamily II)
MARRSGPREVADGVFQFAVLGAQAWLLLDEPVTLLDTGTRGGGAAIWRALERLGRRREELATVVLTHYHPDHLGALPELLATRRAPLRVAIHAAEAPFLQAPARLPNPFQTRLLRALAGPLWPLARLRRPCAVQAALVDGAVVPGRPDVRVVHLPGHTPGSIALHLPERGLVLAGDAFERRRGRLGPPSARFTEDRAAAWASIRRLAAIDFDTLCLSHFPPLQRHAAAAVRALAAG